MTWQQMLIEWRNTMYFVIGIPMLIIIIIIMGKYILPLSQYIINKEIYVPEEEYKKTVKENALLEEQIKKREEEWNEDNIL